MRILHTSDWHLGRQFHGVSLEEDHDAIIAQVEAAIVEHQPNALIIAGDIFDRLTPSQAALRRFSDFIRKVTADGKLAIVLIAGNHDAAAQIGAMGVLANTAHALVRGPLDRDERPLLITDEHGVVAISALPFGYEFSARACFENEGINCPADVLAEQIASARRHLPEGVRWVVAAHAFVEGASTSEGERPLTRSVGGIETVPASLFEGAHYVALGHLHRPQAVGVGHIRYSGAPLAFGFDEEGHAKSMTLVELAADGSVSLSELPLFPIRSVRAIRGKLAELLAAPEGSDDLIRVVLTDEHPQIDPMKRLRVLYPNAVQLSYERDDRSQERQLAEGRAALDQPGEVIANFVRFVREAPITDAEKALVDEVVADLAAGGEAA
ncbi:exonuclease SbcCD subunit D [Sphingobium chlorophenolicum]|uniref:Nuclease SbcCD subunit D n=1 Tax=Sphingobium chlorophenolicum TaxID=46429 RepID=A0A081REV0_SPHCR|nr:exonuclease SbcCD subunit D [Sphingobium chlorophenolicum]KEQ53723.1 Nuclease SbcCD, D subunit [Sphingobium chlorophenolicum]